MGLLNLDAFLRFRFCFFLWVGPELKRMGEAFLRVPEGFFSLLRMTNPETCQPKPGQRYSGTTSAHQDACRLMQRDSSVAATSE
jgi:hypothetical protein